jgi:hypothetical protein
MIERDLECAELSLASFMDRLSRLCKLYGIDFNMPAIELHVKRNTDYKYGKAHIPGISVKECDSFDGVELLLDVGIKCNNLTKPELAGAKYSGAVRQTYKHNEPVRFGYLSSIRKINKNNEEIDGILNSFIQDYFRKYKMREGQKEIISNILAQKSTIGLLPTSAGKSLCYQLASLLTPGITCVIDPIVALMNDQAQGLTEQYGIEGYSHGMLAVRLRMMKLAKY